MDRRNTTNPLTRQETIVNNPGTVADVCQSRPAGASLKARVIAPGLDFSPHSVLTVNLYSQTLAESLGASIVPIGPTSSGRANRLHPVPVSRIRSAGPGQCADSAPNKLIVSALGKGDPSTSKEAR